MIGLTSNISRGIQWKKISRAYREDICFTFRHFWLCNRLHGYHMASSHKNCIRITRIKLRFLRLTSLSNTKPSKEINKRLNKILKRMVFIYLHRYIVQRQCVFLLYVDQHFNVISCRLQPLTTIQIESPPLTILCPKHILFLQIAVFLLQKIKLKIGLWLNF